MKKKVLPPEMPPNCCMSGCANCVWIEYARDLADYYKEGGEEAKEAISKIPNPYVRSFCESQIDFK